MDRQAPPTAPTLEGLFRRIIRNLGLLIGGKVASGLLGLGSLALAVRALGVETFGQLVLIHTAIQAVQTIVKFQTWQAILRYGMPALQEGRVGDFQRLVRFTARLDIASSVAGAAVAAAGIGLFGPRIGLKPEILPLASAYGVSLLFMVTATSDGLLRIFDRFDLLTVEDNVRAAVRLVGAAVLYLLGGGLAWFLALWFVSIAVGGGVSVALAWTQVRKRGLWQPGAASTGDPFDGLWRFVWANNVNTSLALLTNHLATLLVGGMLGSAEAALFRIARQIAEALAKPVKLMTNAVTPELARFVADKRLDLLASVIQRALTLSTAASVVCFGVLLLAGHWLLAVVGGDQAMAARDVLLFLGAAALIAVATFAFEPTLISVGRPMVALSIRLVSAAVYLPSLVALTYISGTRGAGVAAVITAAITAALQSLAVWSWITAQPPAAASPRQ